ncbi:hypothetical protein EX30DRAFT_399146 [Ascodesmis nigricans]|uniref:Heat shock factor binding protein 1-domain-containing protein n=1 Tax=Ascodesmis nigricans TaxID=341454 RepID=A0A4S2MN23_9PEZI|nr:hypothetical protein EX30DRAFT_399146 [Ascodesmis nigricans]
MSTSTPTSTTAATAPTTTKPSTESMATPTELATLVDDLLTSLGTKFQGVSKEIYDKLDVMGRRLDVLEVDLGRVRERGSTGEAGERGEKA